MGEAKHDGLAIPGRVVLARELPFALGTLKVHPPIRQVEANGRSETLEPRVMQVLVALARAEGAVVTRDELVECCWDGVVVGDNAVHRVLSRLRQIAVQADAGFTIETIPRVGYRLATVDRQYPGSEGGAIAAAGSPKRRFLTIALSLAAIVAVGVTTTLIGRLRTPDAPPPAIVAIEPLSTPRNDGAAQTLSIALAADVSQIVAGNAPDLTIVDPAKARPAFSVAGSAETIGADVHAAVRLVDVKNGAILWSDNFVRQASEIDSLRQELAIRLGDVLSCGLGPVQVRSNQLELDTVRTFLKACEEKHIDLQQAEVTDLFADVVERSPAFAAAWSEYAMALARRSSLGGGASTPEEIESAARRALALDPNQALPYLALLDTLGPSDWIGRHRLLDQAARAEPNDPAILAAQASQFASIGRVRDALPLAERVARASPMVPAAYSNLAEGYAYSGRLDAARKVLAEAYRRWPRDAFTGEPRFEIEARFGNPAAAAAMLKRQGSLSRYSARQRSAWLALIRARTSGDRAGASRRLVQLAQGADPGETIDLIQHLTMLGRTDEAYALALKLTPLSTVFADVWFRNYMAPFRRDPRFPALMKNRGVAAIWRESQLMPDFCSEEPLPYRCTDLVSN
ncbi:MAG TPA: winged helix-turn-helix domain-containing protein [Sphingomicrobium sp.]|nr:winged helix-turn-helix domain-containing protein [Sphingomicrobium sp.]